jgi:hypothetical protein
MRHTEVHMPWDFRLRFDMNKENFKESRGFTLMKLHMQFVPMKEKHFM